MTEDQQEMLRASTDRFHAREVLKGGGPVSLTVRIAELIDQHGSLRAAARVLECDPGYLSRLWSGEKNDPGEKLLRRMGLRQIVTYERTLLRPAIKAGPFTQEQIMRGAEVLRSLKEPPTARAAASLQDPQESRDV